MSKLQIGDFRRRRRAFDFPSSKLECQCGKRIDSFFAIAGFTKLWMENATSDRSPGNVLTDVRFP